MYIIDFENMSFVIFNNIYFIFYLFDFVLVNCVLLNDFRYLILNCKLNFKYFGNVIVMKKFL